jgi:hypothetical protein
MLFVRLTNIMSIGSVFLCSQQGGVHESYIKHDSHECLTQRQQFSFFLGNLQQVSKLGVSQLECKYPLYCMLYDHNYSWRVYESLTSIHIVQYMYWSLETQNGCQSFHLSLNLSFCLSQTDICLREHIEDTSKYEVWRPYKVFTQTIKVKYSLWSSQQDNQFIRAQNRKCFKSFATYKENVFFLLDSSR